MVEFAIVFFLVGAVVGLVACKCYYDYLDEGFYSDDYCDCDGEHDD